MKKIFVYASIALFAGLTSCYNWGGPCIEGVGSSIEDIRDVDDFYSVSNTTSFDVYVTQADTFSVRVIAQENLLPIIETYRSGNTLVIDTRDFTCIRNTNSVEVHITLPEIEELSLNSSGRLICGDIDSDLLEISLSGSGRISIDSIFATDLVVEHNSSGKIDIILIDAENGDFKLSGSGTLDFGAFYGDDLRYRHNSSGTIRGACYGVYATDISLSGSGKVNLEGDTHTLTTSHTSSGRIDALDLFAVNVISESSGSGNTYVNVSGDLDVRISGSGSLIYRGNPSNVSYKITGSGNLREY